MCASVCCILCILMRSRHAVCVLVTVVQICFFFKHKTAYEMRIGDWSSDVCSSDLYRRHSGGQAILAGVQALPGQVQTPIQTQPEGILQYAFGQIGRASCRERVCQYVSISEVAVSLKQKYANN